MSAYIQYDFSITNFIKPNIIQNIGSAGNSYDGTAINNPTMNNIGPEPQIMSALFNSSLQQYITISNELNITNNGLTFACWFKSNYNIPNTRLFDFGNGSGVDNINIYINNNLLSFCIYEGTNQYTQNIN